MAQGLLGTWDTLPGRRRSVQAEPLPQRVDQEGRPQPTRLEFAGAKQARVERFPGPAFRACGAHSGFPACSAERTPTRLKGGKQEESAARP